MLLRYASLSELTLRSHHSYSNSNFIFENGEIQLAQFDDGHLSLI